MTEEANSITQPVVLNGAESAQQTAEGTQPVVVTADESDAQMPEWLLKFAATPDPVLVVPSAEDLEEKADFVPPEPTEDNEWHELAAFQEAEDEMTLTGAVEVDVEAPVAEDVSEPISADAEIDPVTGFEQELHSLLEAGSLENAAELIRETKADPQLAEAARKTLRSQLTLSSEAGRLWEIYDELNSSSD